LKKSLLLSHLSAHSGLELHFYPSILTRVNCIRQEVRISGAISEFGCGIVFSSEECSTEVD